MAMSGLTADSRVICKYMRNECLNYKYVYESNHPLNRLISKVSDSNNHIIEIRKLTQNTSKFQKTLWSWITHCWSWRNICNKIIVTRTSSLWNISIGGFLWIYSICYWIKVFELIILKILICSNLFWNSLWKILKLRFRLTYISRIKSSKIIKLRWIWVNILLIVLQVFLPKVLKSHL
jgi:hypothetical protein